jgi:hypothetical protein
MRQPRVKAVTAASRVESGNDGRGAFDAAGQLFALRRGAIPGSMLSGMG